MDYRALIQGDYIKATEFGVGECPAQPTWTIAKVVIEKLESLKMGDTDGATAKLKNKGIVYFREHDKGWVGNSTNFQCVAAMHGNDTNDWIGRRLTMFATNVRVGSKMELGIRIAGSPDIDKEIIVMIKLPRRKPVPMTLRPTGERPAPVEVPPATLAGAEAAAAKGEVAYNEFGRTLTSPEKAALRDSGKGSELRAAAKAVDAKATSDPAEKS